MSPQTVGTSTAAPPDQGAECPPLGLPLFPRLGVQLLGQLTHPPCTRLTAQVPRLRAPGCTWHPLWPFLLGHPEDPRAHLH